MRETEKAARFEGVRYEIRGPVLQAAERLEKEGRKIMKLNVGNPAPFGFDAPEEIIRATADALRRAQGYGDSRGLLQAREAVVRDFREKGIGDVAPEDVFIGNGVSELIMTSMQCLLNPGDEVLVPMPDYPLWTAAVTFSGGRAVHYRCDEASGWNPDIADMRAKVSSRTRAVVVINPNNPTGAVYGRDVLEEIARLAREKGLIVYADEIYGRLTYDGAEHVPMATLTGDDVLTVSFDGLSKAWRAAGFRSGWMVLSGNRKNASGYIEGLYTLSSMRLCANMPAQFAVRTALENREGIAALLLPGGRLRDQRDVTVEKINAIPGLSVTVPRGALYCFPKIDAARFGITDDRKFVLDFLHAKHVLLVHGTGFNWEKPDHFRIVFLPDRDTLALALGKLAEFLEDYRQD